MAGHFFMTRTNIYIDGYNFYFGLLRGGPYKSCKWLDLEQLFVRMLPTDDIQAIKYFTAYCHDDSGKRYRTYTGALAAHCRVVEVIEGNFKRRHRTCKNAQCTFAGSRVFTTYEEKYTDVSIGITMIDDAHRGVCDRMILVSGDSDLVPVLALVRRRFPAIELFVYIPGPRQRFDQATELKAMADRTRSIPANLLRACQLPVKVTVGAAVFRKPDTW